MRRGVNHSHGFQHRAGHAPPGFVADAVHDYTDPMSGADFAIPVNSQFYGFSLSDSNESTSSKICFNPKELFWG